MSEWHVIPRNDLIAHDSSEDCVCGPDVEFVPGGAVFTHHPLGEEEPHEPRADPANHQGS